MSLREGPPPSWQDGQRCFFDTNVLVYTDDGREPEKRALALDLIDYHQHAGSAAISTQVLQEYYSVTTRKLGTAHDVAHRKVQLFAKLPVVQIDPPAILAAIDLHRLHRVSFWDALILHAAETAGCSVLLTEDMQHGASVRGMRIHNPFAAD